MLECRRLIDDAERNVLFHDRIAPGYDAHLTTRPDDLLARRAFQELVTSYVEPGSTLLDYGCGTGLDSVHYSDLGYRVVAYDSSPGMIDQLRRKCDSPLVESFSCDYSAFARRILPGRAQAVVANFAVLNHIRDLNGWFDSITRYLQTPGWIVMSILNPIHWTHLTTPRWWRNALARETGPHSTEPCTTYLHSIGSILRAARGFHLVGRANAGDVVRYDPAVLDEVHGQSTWWRDGRSQSAVRRVLWRTPARRYLGHFVFLVLRRQA
jgi:ubiquinone/menaquinone biosynthesis C-methylase UbiE